MGSWAFHHRNPASVSDVAEPVTLSSIGPAVTVQDLTQSSHRGRELPGSDRFERGGG